MYGSCIFCNASLGNNELLERFPIGRRLAYNQATGRLWAVCMNCERWNLSPIETRWEAIEDAERLFRATPLKVSGENIALAQTTEGLELVRIGTPPKAELIAWRYGDQFGRRRRRHLIVFSGGIVLTAGVAATSVASMAGALGVGIFSVFNYANFARSAIDFARMRRDKKMRIVLRDSSGGPLVLNLNEARAVALAPEPFGFWTLEVPHQAWLGKPGKGSRIYGKPVTLTESAATDAISRLMPHINRDAGSKRQVRDAVQTIDDAGSIDGLIRLASTNREGHKTHFKVPREKMPLSVLPARIRLALEMTLHEDDERRAMEGELAALEARWREADALAKVADSLLEPESIEEELSCLKA